MITEFLGKIAYLTTQDRKTLDLESIGTMDYVIQQLRINKVYPTRVDQESAVLITLRIPQGINWSIGSFHGLRAKRTQLEYHKLLRNFDEGIEDTHRNIELSDPDAITKLCQELPKYTLIRWLIQTGIMWCLLIACIFGNLIRKIPGMVTD